MKFTISRTSSYGPDNKHPPTDGAVRDWSAASESRDAWVIEIADLEALLALSRREGELVFLAAERPEGRNHIEIYDDYRE